MLSGTYGTTAVGDSYQCAFVGQVVTVERESKPKYFRLNKIIINNELR